MKATKTPIGLFKTIFHDTALTLSAEAIVLITFFMFYRFLASYYGPEEVGVYSLMRRILALMLPILMLGLSEGLSRYIAMAKDEAERKIFILCGSLILFLSLGIVVTLLNLDVRLSAVWLFGDHHYTNVIFPYSLLLVGLSLHTFTYACLRGNLHIKALNLLQVINVGVLPLVILLLARKNGFLTVVVLIGISHCIVALVFLNSSLRQIPFSNLRERFNSGLWNLLVFSVPRVPASVAGAGLISLSPMVASRFITISEVGYLSLALAFLIGVGSSISPLGTILLPHISSLLGRGEVDRFDRRLYLLIGAIIQSLLFLSGQLIVFTDYIVTIWMGKQFLPSSAVMITVFTSLVAYGFYIIARNILDAISTKPLNSINSIISLGLLAATITAIIILRLPGRMVVLFALAFSISFNLLGVLSYYAIRKRFPFNLREDWRHLKWGVILNTAACILGLLLKQYVTQYLVIWLAFESILLILYLFALMQLKFEWVQVIYRKTL